jgi:ClpP class serine protease
MTSLARLENDLFNKPHLIQAASLESIFQYLDSRNAGTELSVSSIKTTVAKPKVDTNSKTAILEIRGPLSYRSTRFDALCGLQSYQQIESDFRSLVNSGAKKIALIIDSPGGEAYGVFETAALLRTLADKNGVKLLCYVDGNLASAAYALSCVSHEVILNPEASAGSIGVVVKLRNNNKQLKMAGIEDTYIFAGENKIAFNKSGEWSSDFINDIQSKINTTYDKFTSFVAVNRKIAVRDVVATKAKMFDANQAVSLKLADSIMTRDEFFKYFYTGTKPLTVKPSSVVLQKPKIDGVEKALMNMFPQEIK